MVVKKQQQQQKQHQQNMQQQQHAAHQGRHPNAHMTGRGGRNPHGRHEPPRKLQTVDLDAVKGLLRASVAMEQSGASQSQQPLSLASINGSHYVSFLSKLADGENDAFLQHLLLLEYIRSIKTPAPVNASSASKDGSEGKGDGKDSDDESSSAAAAAATQSLPIPSDQDNRRVSYACDRIQMILRRVELAYESMSGMLPKVLNDEVMPTNVDDAQLEDTERPVVVPDLLPPCTSAPGDATLAFFRACNGDCDDDKADGKNPQDDLSSMAPTEAISETGDSSVDDDGGDKNNGNHGSATSMFANMFAKRASFSKRSFGSVFRKRKNSKDVDADGGLPGNGDGEMNASGEYTVTIEREMLGLTVENVLERTVVRTVLGGGPAKKAGARVGSLIVKVGNIETKNLTHFETIDELRQSQRPLQLVLRQISDDALRSAREEMGRLIRGAGFGRIIDGEQPRQVASTSSTDSGGNDEAADGSSGQSSPTAAEAAAAVSRDRNLEFYSTIVRKRWIDAANARPIAKKDEPVLKAGEKIVWVLTLFVIGLEREAERLQALAKVTDGPRRNSHAQYHHTAKDYLDAARSVSKVLLDFTKKRMDPPPKPPPQPQAMPGGRGPGGRQGPRGSPMGRGGRGRGRGRGPLVPGMAATGMDTIAPHERLLLQIGDVLQRTRTFLADPTSPPAALLRGELIACLCDILDADTDMELSEEENDSAAATGGGGGGGGGKGGPITDLGAAGSLLKLIVLNCPIMRSPECGKEAAAAATSFDEAKISEEEEHNDSSEADCHRLHAGNRFLAVVHRLAASRSTSARITACSLGPVLWSHLDFPHQLQLRGVITRALHDVEVIVRKSTATVLHEIAELVYDPRSVPWLVLMCERAMTDPEPLLRSAAMTLTWHLAEHLPNAFLGDASKGSRYLCRLPSRDDPIFADVYLLQCKLLPVATRLAEDRAPPVRLAVAAQCDRLCDALGDHWSSVIIDVLVAMLTDSDERVRGEAVMCVPRLAEIVLLSSPPGVIPTGESSVLEALIPAAIKLQKDGSSSVRVSLATAAGELLTLLVALQRPEGMPTDIEGVPAPAGTRHQKRHVDEKLIPLVQKLLHDQDPEVTSSALRAVTNASRDQSKGKRSRFNTEDDDSKSVASMHSHTSMDKPVFLPVLSEDHVQRLLPTLAELGNSKQWRVRQTAVEIVPALLGCTTKLETRTEIANLCVRLMKDQVDAVRRTAAECLCLGGSSMGSHGEDVSAEWMNELVIPQVRKCADHDDFKQRLLGLKMIEVIFTNGVCPAKWKNKAEHSDDRSTPLRELIKITLTMANDPIANVRLNVGKILAGVLNGFEDEECQVIMYSLLQQLKAEKSKEERQDRDVIFFASRCLDKLRQRLDGH